MPIFTIPLHEGNDCHEPAGSPTGGQFCSTQGGRFGRTRAARQAVTPAAVDRRIRTIMRKQQYAHYGVRVDMNPQLKVGDRAPTSSDWSDVARPVRLTGTSAIPAEHWKRVIDYSGHTLVLLGSARSARGTDRHEIVMADAVVLAVWKLPPGFWAMGM